MLIFCFLYCMHVFMTWTVASYRQPSWFAVVYVGSANCEKKQKNSQKHYSFSKTIFFLLNFGYTSKIMFMFHINMTGIQLIDTTKTNNWPITAVKWSSLSHCFIVNIRMCYTSAVGNHVQEFVCCRNSRWPVFQADKSLSQGTAN